MTPEMITELSATALVGTLLFMMFRYLTKDLSQELHKQYEIICDLIKAKNELAKTVSENTNDLTDMLNRIAGILDTQPASRRKRK